MNTQEIIETVPPVTPPNARLAAALPASPIKGPGIIAIPPVQLDTEKGLQVFDRLATNGARTHDLADGNGVIAQYKFPDAQTACLVPMSAAIKLVGVDGFDVVDDEGNVWKADKERKEEFTMKSDETVAKYHELTAQALKERAQQINLPPQVVNGRKEDIIIHLVRFNEQRQDAKAKAVELGLTKSLQELLNDASVPGTRGMSSEQMAAFKYGDTLTE